MRKHRRSYNLFGLDVLYLSWVEGVYLLILAFAVGLMGYNVYLGIRNWPPTHAELVSILCLAYGAWVGHSIGFRRGKAAQVARKEDPE